uniref:Pentatricopeptide repeat-containing protein n=1 Tax=Oryza meridionalis TaxID=40149 RepID=A0A0E0DF95_9ORYZ
MVAGTLQECNGGRMVCSGVMWLHLLCLDCNDLWIHSYAHTGLCLEALTLFIEMQTTVLLLNPNEATYIRRKGLPLTIVLGLGSALVDLYAKCGCSDNADKHSKLVAACEELRGTPGLFSSMCEANVKAHGRGIHWHFVSNDPGLWRQPRIEHYGCMIDLLVRAGLIDEAYQFIKTMR